MQLIIGTDSTGKKQHYIKKQKLGSGGFAKCYLLQNLQTHQKHAAKILPILQLHNKQTHKKILQEIDLHRQLTHPNIVQFHSTFQYEDQIYILMELCQNNTLKEFIRSRVRITEFQAKCYLWQIVEGVEYLHGCSVVHRDIKLGNLFLNFRMEVKIGDFGLSRQLKQPKQRRFTTCGTPNYIAPEILKETGHSFQADIWAIGIILYAMLIGKPPFESDSVQNTYRKIKSNSYQFPKNIPLSNEAKSLIKSILDPNPKTRITLDQIKKHAFLNKEIQKIPKLMPPYTISIPPQANFLKQYVNQKNMKLLVYPKRVNDRRHFCEEDEEKVSKLGRVLSADKKMLMRLESFNQDSKEISSLNRGRYLKILRSQSLSKSSIKQLKSIRSAASIGSFTPKPKQPQVLSPQPAQSPSKPEQDTNEIICYYDVSDKYGIAYLLSNGNYGIIYNDRTSLTAICDPSPRPENEEGFRYAYFDKSVQIMDSLPEKLKKKKQILAFCQQKLEHYRKNNILIPYCSETYGRKYIKFNHGFVIKLSNGIMQFFWGADSVTLRNYKWVRWRVNQVEGQGKLGQKNLADPVQQKLQQVKNFLLRECQNSKARNDDR